MSDLPPEWIPALEHGYRTFLNARSMQSSNLNGPTDAEVMWSAVALILPLMREAVDELRPEYFEDDSMLVYAQLKQRERALDAVVKALHLPDPTEKEI